MLRLTDPTEKAVVRAVVEKAEEIRLQHNQDLAVRTIDALAEFVNGRA